MIISECYFYLHKKTIFYIIFYNFWLEITRILDLFLFILTFHIPVAPTALKPILVKWSDSGSGEFEAAVASAVPCTLPIHPGTVALVTLPQLSGYSIDPGRIMDQGSRETVYAGTYCCTLSTIYYCRYIFNHRLMIVQNSISFINKIWSKSRSILKVCK